MKKGKKKVAKPKKKISKQVRDDDFDDNLNAPRRSLSSSVQNFFNHFK